MEYVYYNDYSDEDDYKPTLKSQAPKRRGLYHGTKINWYENGNKKSEIPYNDGKLDGESKEWYDNGRKKSQSLHTEDKPEYHRKWYKNGNVEKIQEFQRDRVDIVEFFKSGEKKCEYSCRMNDNEIGDIIGEVIRFRKENQ